MSSRPVLGLTQLPIQWVPELKRPGHEANHSYNQCRDQEYVDLYIHFLIGLYALVFNYLSTWTNLLLLCSSH
jgi:hypothetical protein